MTGGNKYSTNDVECLCVVTDCDFDVFLWDKSRIKVPL